MNLITFLSLRSKRICSFLIRHIPPPDGIPKSRNGMNAVIPQPQRFLTNEFDGIPVAENNLALSPFHSFHESKADFRCCSCSLIPDEIEEEKIIAERMLIGVETALPPLFVFEDLHEVCRFLETAMLMEPAGDGRRPFRLPQASLLSNPRGEPSISKMFTAD